MLDLICIAIIVLGVGYVIAQLAIQDPESFDEMKSNAKEVKNYFVSLRGNTF